MLEESEVSVAVKSKMRSSIAVVILFSRLGTSPSGKPAVCCFPQPSISVFKTLNTLSGFSFSSWLFQFDLVMISAEDESGQSSVGFEFLKFLRHHYVCEVSKLTPSGRLQSAVLVILPDAVVLCSHRGGIHRYIPFLKLAGIEQLPRGRVLFRVREEHNLLLSIPSHTKVVAAVAQLHAGLRASVLPITTNDTMPLFSTLELRPSSQYVSTIPKSLQNAIQLAYANRVKALVTDTKRKLLGISTPEAENNNRSPFRSEGELRGRAFGAATGEASGGAAQDNSLLASRQYSDGEPPSPSRPPSVPNVARSPSSQGSTLAQWRAASAAYLQLKSPRTSQEAEEAEETALDLTILIASNRGLSMTFPALVSLWRYFQFISAHLPGGRQAPVLEVRCVEGNAINLNEGLFYQTLQQFAVAVPHTVTLRRGTSGEGVNFDGEVFWANPTDLQFTL
jgi:hypothetical protein